MRRYRKNRSTWFPIIPFEEPDGTGGGIGRTDDKRELTVWTNPGIRDCIAIPLIPNESFETGPANSTETLRDFVEGQTCIIERIVGKIVWSMQQITDGGYTPRLALCCTAFAVLPVDGDGNPDIGSDEWDPLLAKNAHQPWLWRRTWLLANTLAWAASNQGYPAPHCNEFFASRDDGPHIDTKGTKRAIRREQRIFMIHSVLNADPAADEGDNGLTYVNADVRVLGRMTRARNRSNFK